ncbi:HyaD/HybD family hydrogenase maturation endopeptidase [Desulfobacterales bacterium HSG16]|nr:HyaD/HybD family hydrogenase maturation endopeptidase [Desulfobacterales bacterium HSG16]
MEQPHIMILGVGCLLLTDEGFGIHVINRLNREYNFSENVSVVDGGVLGMNLMGTISEADRLIVVDVIRNGGEPGTLYRIDHEDIPERIRAKNSLHQIDFLEALTLCQALDHVPETVILGVEPKDMTNYGIQPTPLISSKIEQMLKMVIEETEKLGATCEKKEIEDHVPCNPF